MNTHVSFTIVTIPFFALLTLIEWAACFTIELENIRINQRLFIYNFPYTDLIIQHSFLDTVSCQR